MSFTGGVDLLSYLSQTMDQLTTTHVGVFLGDGYTLFHWLAIMWLIVAGCKVMAASVSARHDGQGAVEVLTPIAKVVGVYCLLHYYNLNTIPGTHFSISTMFPEMGKYLAHQIDLSALDAVNDKIMRMGVGVNALVLAVAGPAALAGYFAFKLVFVIIEGILLFVNITPFLFQGAGALFGPYFMVAPLVPFCGFLLRNWMLFMAGMALYRAVGAALVYTWCTALSWFIDNSIHGDYSITHFLALFVLLGAFTIGLVLSLIGIPIVVGALLQGSSAAVQGLSSAVAAAGQGAASQGAAGSGAASQGASQGVTGIAETVSVIP